MDTYICSKKLNVDWEGAGKLYALLVSVEEKNETTEENREDSNFIWNSLFQIYSYIGICTTY